MTNPKHKSGKNKGGVLSTSRIPSFPTQALIIREVINALGTKQTSNAKDLDDYVNTGDTDYQQFSKILEEFIFEPIRSMTCNTTAQFLKKEIDHFFKNYLGLVKLVALDRLKREEVLPLIIEHYFSVRAAVFLTNFQKLSGGLSPIHFVDSDKTAIDAVFNWIDENKADWNKDCTKEEKDKFASWRKGKHLPYLTSFKLLPLSPENKTLLLIARAFDYFRFKDSVLGKRAIDLIREHLLVGFLDYDHGEPLSIAQINANKKFPLSMEALSNCQKILLSSDDCSEINKEYALEQIEKLKAAFKKEDPHGLMTYLVNWCEARWYVKAGNLKDAVKAYKLTFEQCLYSAGKVQEIIYKEALIVAAMKRDKAFLNRLKNHGITFGYFSAPLGKDSLDLEVNNKKNRSDSNIVEDWEVEHWRKKFIQTFTEQMLFKDTQPYKDDAKAGILVSSDEVKLKLKPDQKIKVGSWKKQTPQLVHFILENNIIAVQKLLNKGADVNVFSESGETPILMAVQNMNLFELDAPLDDTCFNLITSQSHTQKTVNRRSTKLKLLPLVCAVNTGKLDVVSKLLKMEAEVDRRGDTDELTALYKCITRIMLLRNPELLMNSFSKTPTPELLENIRRRSGGIAGNSHDELANNFEATRQNKSFADFMESYTKILTERISSLKEDSFRDIAYLLIQNGANPNIEMKSPIKGYTPLMLAAECDEAELFEEMLRYGGKPDKYYKHPKTGQPINCFNIALAFRSHQVAKILKNKYGYND